MVASSEIISRLEEIILWAAEALGPKRIKKLLENQEKFTSLEKRNIEVLLCMAETEFVISRRNLIYGTSTGKRIDARDICWYLLKENLCFSLLQIREIFGNKDAKQNISKAIIRIKNLDLKSKVDAALILQKKAIETEFLKNKK